MLIIEEMCVCVCVYVCIYIYIYSAAWKFVNPLEFSIFLHKYDPKHNQIFAQVLKVDKENWIKTNETKIFSLSFIYSGKWSNIAYLWVAKVCESFGLAVNLKVKLESICAEVFSVSAMTITCQYMTCFIQRTLIYQSLIMFVEVNHVTNKGDYWGHREKSWCCSSG